MFGKVNNFYRPQNEVWVKVIFSEACVKNSVHGGGVEYLGKYPPGRYTPQAGTSPGRYTPLAGTPPGQVHSTQGRYTHLAGTPPGRYTQPRAGTPPGRYNPPGRYTHPGQVHPRAGTPTPGRYTPSPSDGQCTGGTHPTGMQSCLCFSLPIWLAHSAKFQNIPELFYLFRREC